MRSEGLIRPFDAIGFMESLYYAVDPIILLMDPCAHKGGRDVVSRTSGFNEIFLIGHVRIAPNAAP
jgi:hypothetical protein